MERCATVWLVEPESSRSEEKGIGSKFPGERAKKKAGFFFRILVLKAPEIENTPLQLSFFFRCIMIDSTVEDMDDEELLMYYEATRKLLESRMKDESLQNGKVGILQQKIDFIEDELKSRSLWETE
jgi:hypothetical protein